MFMMPFQILGMWLRGLLSLALIGGGIWLLVLWNGERTGPLIDPPRVADPEAPAQREEWRPGLNRGTLYLAGGALLLLWSAGGGLLVSRWLASGRPGDEPQDVPGGVSHDIPRPDGSRLHVEVYGHPDNPPLILTHGWGLDGASWCYAKQELARGRRLIVWDLPGLGRSTSPTGRDWSLEKLAGHLAAVLELAGDKPAILAGQSIGGMITLTFCKLYPELLGTKVAGLALIHTTHTNPVKTASLAPLYTAIQKPVLEPLCWLMVALAPFVWLMNALTWLRGSAHRSVESACFSGKESGGQLEFMTRYFLQDWPATIARGYLAMFRYDATGVLPVINVPTLVVAGDKDSMCVPAASKFMADTIPGARLAVLSPAAHAGHVERHADFARHLGEFATQVQGTGAAKREPQPA
ncbi:MAG: alpha/beta hydrolase [Gemmataceae bacterium]|nr:alpha/beta hydrolase [Gemmataceae bacterium]